ncbi:MAG: STAS domain-containing protein [Spirochaetota bacterium]
MTLSQILQPRANSFKLKATRLSLEPVDSAKPTGLALVLAGDLDTNSSGEFQSFVLESLSEMKPPSTLILDLSGLTYISSTGVGSLTAILGEAKRRHIALSICGIPKHIWNIIDLLGFTAFFSFIDAFEACP